VLGTLPRRQGDFYERGVASSDKDKLRRAAQELPAQAPAAYFGHRAVSRALGTLPRRQNGYDERGIASCDRSKLHRAAQEL
jgi:hypothetical protein